MKNNKNIIGIVTSIFVFLLLASSTSFAAESVNLPQPEKEWTFMLFMAADNNLEEASIVDINEIEKYGSTENVNFVAQIDRNGGYSKNSSEKWSGTRRYYITKDKSKKTLGSPMLEDLGDVDSASPKTLTEFVAWAKDNFPARKYALILWNHGSGWKEVSAGLEENDVEEGRGYEIGISTSMEAQKQSIKNAPMSFSFSGNFNQPVKPAKKSSQKATPIKAPKISYNISYDYTSNTSMDIPTLAETLKEVVNILGQPIEMLGFDACLMQMAEVGWASYPYAKCQVGSPDLEPERGWAYEEFVSALVKQPDLDGLSLAKLVTQAYAKSYSNGYQGNTAVAMSVMDFSKAEKFKTDLNRFCSTVIKNISRDIDKIEELRKKSLMYSYNDYIDLGHFLTLVAKDSSVSSETKSAALALLKTMCGNKGEGGFIARVASYGDKFKETRGMSIFFPNRAGFKAYQKRYKIQPLAKGTKWFEFISELANPNMPFLKLEDIQFLDNNKDGRIAAGEEIDGNLIIQNYGRQAIENATVFFESDSKYLVENKLSIELSKLPAAGRKKTMKAFKLKIADDAPVHEEINYTITLQGKGIPDSVLTGSIFIKEAFSSTSNALFVYYDGYSPSVPVLEKMFQDAGIPFDSWDRSIDGDIRPEVLKRYSDGWVFICCQDSTPDQSLNEDEITALDEFLKVGGRVVLDGQDLAFCLRDSDFLYTRCKAEFIQDDVNVHVVSGVGNFLKGKAFQIFGGDGSNNQKWPDEIDALTGAEVIFKYEEGARDIADEREFNGPDHKPTSFTRGVNSSGAAAIRVRDGYRLMLFGFNIESVNSPAQRCEIMKGIADFMKPDAESEIRNYARAAGRRVVADKYRSVDRVMTERADLLSSVEERLVKEIKEAAKTDPTVKDKVLSIFRNLSQKEQKAAFKLERSLKAMFDFDNQQSENRNR